MFSIRTTGDFTNLKRFLKSATKGDIYDQLNKYGQQGVDALAQHTPKDSGVTAASWGYQIDRGKHQTRIIWNNTNINKGVNIAIILQFGHGTGTGGYVQGRDYINPAVQPTMDIIARNVWEAVKKA